MLEEIKAPVIAWHTLAYEEIQSKTIKSFYSIIKKLFDRSRYEPEIFKTQHYRAKKILSQ
jgi:hypothetical protein